MDNASLAMEPELPADPLTEAGDVVWYVRPPSGGQYGPATGKLMHQWLAEERVSPDTLVWHEGWRDWQRADAVFPQLQTNDPLADLVKADVPFRQAVSSPPGQTNELRHHKNFIRLVIALVILAAIIIIYLIYWAFFRGSAPAPANSRSPSTRLELRDTLKGYDFL